MHLVARGNGTPNDNDEVSKREVSECDDCVCDLESIRDQSIVNGIRNTVDLTSMLTTKGDLHS